MSPSTSLCTTYRRFWGGVDQHVGRGVVFHLILPQIFFLPKKANHPRFSSRCFFRHWQFLKTPHFEAVAVAVEGGTVVEPLFEQTYHITPCFHGTGKSPPYQ